MGPFGSDQCRHVDDFGAKKGNPDDFVANKSSFGAKNHYFIDVVPKKIRMLTTFKRKNHPMVL